MKKIISLSLIGLFIATSSLSADARKGQKLYLKKLKAPCGISGTTFSQKYTQDKWKSLKDSGNFKNEVLKICPNAKIKDKWIDNIYDFSYQYASDSGNVPSC